MSQVNGVVEYVNGPNQFGLYSIKVDGQYYGNGKVRPTVSKGDNVKFEAVKKGKYFNVEGEIEVLSSGNATVVSFPNSTARGAAGASRSVRFNDRPWDPAVEETRQRSIIMQHSQEMAVSLAKLMLERGAIPIKDTDAAGKKYDIINTYVHNIAQEMFDKVLATEVKSGNQEATINDSQNHEAAKAAGDTTWRD